MSGAPGLRIHAVASDAAGAVNEDAFGHAGRALWVLDGATGVAAQPCTRGPTDAAWLAHWVSGWLHEASLHAAGRLTDQIDALAAALREAFDRHAPAGLPAAELPSACLALLDFDTAASALDIAVVGDITVLVATPDGALLRASDDAAQPFGERTLAAWRAARAAGGEPAQWWAAAREVIVGNRAMANQPGGYGVVHPRLPWTQRLCRWRVPAPPGTRVLAMSDGLYRLVDLFGHLDDRALLARAFDPASTPLLSTLRALEAQDPTGIAHPRIKPSDDATFVAAEIVAGGGR